MLPRIIYGAGCQGIFLFRQLKGGSERPVIHCFVDGNPEKQGGTLEGLPVYGPDYLETLVPGSYTILVAVGRHYGHVRKYLENLGWEENIHFEDASPRPVTYAELNPDFIPLMDRVRPYSLLSDDRLEMLYQLAKHASAVPGDMAEVGVYRGGTAFLMASVIRGSGKELHLFDTFSGLPETSPGFDLHRTGDFSDTGAAGVSDLLSEFFGVYLYPGFFPDTVPAGWGSKVFSYVHIDVDIFRSAGDCCRYFYPRMAAGGIMIFDDYGFPSCPGIRRAVDEYFCTVSDKPVYLPTGQAYVIKSAPHRMEVGAD